MRPSKLAAAIAHFGTVQEFGWPLLLITVDNDTVRTIAIIGMILFHLNITSMFPLAVPLEWNLFMIFGLLFLFGHNGDVPLSTLDDPLLIAFLAIPCIGLPILGGLRPGQDLLPAVDALLRRQLGDDASGSSARGAGRRRSSTPGSRSRRGSSSSRWATIYDPRDGGVPAQQGALLPGDALPRPGAERPAAARRR